MLGNVQLEKYGLKTSTMYILNYIIYNSLLSHFFEVLKLSLFQERVLMVVLFVFL